MAAASPILATVNKRTLAAVVDAGPLLLLIIFAAALADFTVGGPKATALAAAIVYLAYHAGFNHAFSGETLGRRMLGIRLVDGRGAQLSLTQSVGRPFFRVLWFGAFCWVAIITYQIWLIATPILVDLILISVLPWRQSTADFACHTLVINSPQAQPHRAPAGPMYSATDAEFGNPPRRIKSETIDV